jgi:hypothetical protein
VKIVTGINTRAGRQTTFLIDTPLATQFWRRYQPKGAPYPHLRRDLLGQASSQYFKKNVKPIALITAVTKVITTDIPNLPVTTQATESVIRGDHVNSQIQDFLNILSVVVVIIFIADLFIETYRPVSNPVPRKPVKCLNG